VASWTFLITFYKAKGDNYTFEKIFKPYPHC